VIGPCGNDTDEKMFTKWVTDHKVVLREFFAKGGAIVADRGFRSQAFQDGVRAQLAPCAITFAIPASKVAGQQRQDVVDYSRRVASERSQVEQLNARAKMECKLLDKRKLSSSIVKHLAPIAKIAYFVEGCRLWRGGGGTTCTHVPYAFVATYNR